MPESWKLVPMIATEQMLDAGLDVSGHEYWNGVAIWEAMLDAAPKMSVREGHPGFWTHDDQAAKEGVGHLYYFAPSVRSKPPYTHQREVKAIIDIADDGTLAGVELIDDMPPPPKQ